MTLARFPHSDTLGSQFACQLPEAYRRLQRPSSAPDAKASTVCSYKLKTKTKRCSRPLYSSQTTHPHPQPPPHRRPATSRPRTPTPHGLVVPHPNLSLIHISEPTRLRRISYAVFCLKKKNQKTLTNTTTII